MVFLLRIKEKMRLTIIGGHIRTTPGTFSTDKILKIDFLGGLGNRVREETARLPVPTAYMSGAWDTQRNVAYIFGGSTFEGISNQIIKYDPQSQQTIIMQPVLPTARVYTSVVWDPVMNVAYILGGRNSGGTQLTDILKFDPSANNGQGSITQVGALPSPQGFLGYIAAFYEPVQRKIYVFGNQHINSQYQYFIVMFNPDNGQSTVLTSPSMPTDLFLSMSISYDEDRQIAYLFRLYGNIAIPALAFDTRRMTITQVVSSSYNIENLGASSIQAAYSTLLGKTVQVSDFVGNRQIVFFS